MNDTAKVISLWPTNGLHGRRKIYTDKQEITEANVVEVVSKALAVHAKNRAEIQYLYDYSKGKQDIRSRRKQVRPEINNKVTVNHANEIVTFKSAYLLGEPIQYVSVGDDDKVSENVNRLNEYMRAESKEARDKEIADWLHICGVGVRMVLPDDTPVMEGSPVSLYTLDPRDAFVIYWSGLGNKPLAGVYRQRDEDGNWYSCVYTATNYYEVAGDEVITNEAHILNQIPIIEYVNDDSRMGAFEGVVPLLNAINTVVSNRVDDIEQYVQSLLVFENCDIDSEQYKQLREDGAIKIKGDEKNPARVYRVGEELSQSGTQTAVDDLYQKVLTICGMPNRNGGSSTSDTGTAVIYRDGFAEAESRAKNTEKSWLRSETAFLKLVLHICSNTQGAEIELDIHNVRPEFTRKNFSNIQSKAQVLAELLNNSKVHPKYAYIISGLFPDAEEAYRAGMEWNNTQQAEMEKTIEEAMKREREERVRTGGQSDTATEEEGDPEV